MEEVKKISILIVDDEKQSRTVLKRLLEFEGEKFQVIGEACNVEEAYKMILEYSPQLVFLDIQMPHLDGFELLKKFELVPFEVIFVTSYDRYAINAIKFSALDYLLKPIEIVDLKNALKKATLSVLRKEDNNFQIVNLLHSLDSDVLELKVAVHAHDKVKMISELSIVYIEGDKRYCHIYTNTNEQFVTSKYLQDFEEYFRERNSFIRINKSFIINANHIRQYSKGDPFIIEMMDGKCFEVSRRKKPEVLEKLRAQAKGKLN